MTNTPDNNLQTGLQQLPQHELPTHDYNTDARVARKFGPGTASWYIDTITTPQNDAAIMTKQAEETQKLTFKSTVNDLRNGLVKSAKKLKGYLVNGFTSKDAKLPSTDSLVNSTVANSKEEDAAQQAMGSLLVDESIQPSPVEEVAEEAPTLEGVIDSFADNISKIIADAEEDLKQNDDILTGIIVGIAKELHTELRKEKLNWSKIDLLVRQLSVMLVQKMANNDHKTIQEELDQLQRDIDKVAQSYKGKWEMALGIISGALSVAGGTFGLAGGFGALGGVASTTLKSLQGVSQALGSVGQGVGQFGSIARNANERDRAVHQYEMERDRGYKSNAEESLRNNRSAKTAQINQNNSTIEAMFRAWIAVVS